MSVINYGGIPEASRAVLARIGGNLYRRAINGNIHTQPGFYRDEDRMARQDGYIRENAESLYDGTSYLIGRYWHGTGPDDPSRFWGVDHVAAPRTYAAPLLPEAAFDWPIYRAALGTRTEQTARGLVRMIRQQQIVGSDDEQLVTMAEGYLAADIERHERHDA